MYGETDEEMEDFVSDYSDVSEVDTDYEFDASRFFDFTLPESFSEAEDAERWFEFAGSYSPSPFAMKLKWREDLFAENENASLKSNDGESTISSSNCDMDPGMLVLDDNRKGPKSHNDMVQDIPKTKTKSMAKSSKIRSSTLMKPTASHLAKQNQAREVHSSRLLGRSQRPLTTIDEGSSRNSLRVDRNATKRQKLENGYLCKVAHLKHQSLLLHKLSKVRQDVANTVNSRLKVTIPREPDLETAHRAERHRSRNNSEPGENSKSKVTFKARPLNRKILKAPSLPSPKKSKSQSQSFQLFHLKTSERAVQHSSANYSESISKKGTTGTERLNCEDAPKQEKCEPLKRVKSRPLSKKEVKLSNDNRISCNPPIELFNKLSLKSEVRHNAISHPKEPLHTKGSKENVPDSFKQKLRVS